MKLMNGTDVIIYNDTITWVEQEKGWQAGNTIIIDVNKEFVLVNEQPISPIQFKLRFTPQERVAIYASADALVKDFISILDDTRLQLVDLTLPSTIDAIDYLIKINLIKANRKDAILA